MALSESDAWADCLGVCRVCGADPDGPHADGCPDGLGLGAARGDVVIDGERCSGPCRAPLAAGEPFVHRDDGDWCLGCASREAA